jgi:hypothetical protein
MNGAQAEYKSGVKARPEDPTRRKSSDTRLADILRSTTYKELSPVWTGEGGISQGLGRRGLPKKKREMPAPCDTRPKDVDRHFAKHVDNSFRELVVRPQPWAV